VKGVVQRDDGPFHQKRREEVEIQLHAGPGVVAVDPQKTNGPIPTLRHFG
jgi:hypothetical protein